MNQLISLLTRRYLIHSVNEKTVSTMVKICFVGIFLGSFSLALVTAITNGFEVEIHKKMQGVHAHALIQSSVDPLNVEAITKVIHAEFSAVIGIAPTTYGYVLIKCNNQDAPHVALLRAIDPTAEATVSVLDKKIITDTPADSCPLSHALTTNKILVGKRFAQSGSYSAGDTIQLLYSDLSENSSSNRMSLSQTKTTIGGIFQTGIDDFDAHVIFCTFDFFNELFPESGVCQLNLKFKPGTRDTALIQALRNRLGLEVSSWKELYPALVSALTLEKYVTFLIITLITLVASMNIVSLLFMEITNKRTDIAILQVMGASKRLISSVFMTMGLLLSTIATSCGIFAAYGVSIFFEHYPCIKLPDAYYVSHLPIKMDWHIGLVVFLVVISLSTIASWLPTRRINTINIAQILRSEG